MINFDSEKAMEDVIFDFLNDQGDIPWRPGAAVLHVERQFSIGKHGIVDLVIHWENPHSNMTYVEVVELKNSKIKPSHMAQLARYKNFFDKSSASTLYSLIGLSTVEEDKSDDCFLYQESEWIDVFEVSVSMLDGVVFSKVSGWTPNGKHVDCDDLLKAAFPDYERLELPKEIQDSQF